MLETWLASVVLLTTGEATCAGVVVEPGLVATAYHCVATGLRPRVETRDGAVAIGRTVAADPAVDLALVAAPGLVALPLRVAEAPPSVGTRAYALGHPMSVAASGPLDGTLRWSATEGIVSAVGTTMLQVDAAMNPGNSGGPVVDDSGQVLGIASRKLRAEGLAFATRAEALRRLLAERRAPPLLGGTWDLGVGMIDAVGLGLGVDASISIRERVVARGWLALAPGTPSIPAHPVAAATLSFRQRIGRAPLSLAIDVGPGVLWNPMPATGSADLEVLPVAAARLGFGPLGLGGWYAPWAQTWGVAVDVPLPGARGTW